MHGKCIQSIYFGSINFQLHHIGCCTFRFGFGNIEIVSRVNDLDIQQRKIMSFQQYQYPDFTLATVVVDGMIGMSNLFIYCYFGKLTTVSYEMMADCVYEMNWYNQPIKLQKYTALMIAGMQQPVYYEGFNITTMNLSTFIKVIE